MYTNTDTEWNIDIKNSSAYGVYATCKNKKMFTDIFCRNANLAAFRYDVEGLPDTMRDRVIKQGHLWYQGVCYFVLDDAPDTAFALPAVAGGLGFNMYGDLGDCYAFGMNGDVFHIRLDIRGADNSRQLARMQGGISPYRITAEGHGVFVRENYMLYPFINTTIFYSEQIADTMRAMENSRYWLKHPVGMSGTEKERATWEKYRKAVDDNLPYIWIYDTETRAVRPSDHVQPQNMNDATDFTRPATEVIDWYEQQYWRECGIQNMGGQIDKKGENLVNAEVSHTDDYTALKTQMLLETLNSQLDEVHKLPGCENIRYVERKQDGNVRQLLTGSQRPLPDNGTSADNAD